ncbi:MAG TPA: hypothetical protein VGY54_06760 [Polyangiaceae bacterium]|nr:hypothetical protein [Polyangiaceae bacterium]
MRKRIAVPSLTPVAVEMTLTAPDCVLPPTVMADFVSVSVSVGSVDAGADAAPSKLNTARNDATSAPSLT